MARAIEWAKRVEGWRRSGLSAREYAAEVGLNASTLTYWRWKLGYAAGDFAVARKGTRGTVATECAAFVEVVPSTTVAAAIEVALPSGARLRVPSGADEETLGRVVRVLESAR